MNSRPVQDELFITPGLRVSVLTHQPAGAGKSLPHDPDVRGAREIVSPGRAWWCGRRPDADGRE